MVFSIFLFFLFVSNPRHSPRLFFPGTSTPQKCGFCSTSETLKQLMCCFSYFKNEIIEGYTENIYTMCSPLLSTWHICHPVAFNSEDVIMIAVVIHDCLQCGNELVIIHDRLRIPLVPPWNVCFWRGLVVWCGLFLGSVGLFLLFLFLLVVWCGLWCGLLLNLQVSKREVFG